VFFVEPGPSLITKGVEGSENEDGAFDFVWDDLLIDEDECDDIEMVDSQ
jgi:hypothetical protein